AQGGLRLHVAALGNVWRRRAMRLHRAELRPLHERRGRSGRPHGRTGAGVHRLPQGQVARDDPRQPAAPERDPARNPAEAPMMEFRARTKRSDEWLERYKGAQVNPEMINVKLEGP